MDSIKHPASVKIDKPIHISKLFASPVFGVIVLFFLLFSIILPSDLHELWSFGLSDYKVCF